MATSDPALPSEHLVLAIPLVDNIPAAQLSKLLRSLEWYYRASLWLDRLEFGMEDRFEQYHPRRLEDLWIARLEIGSPNVLKMRGMRKQVLQLATLLSAMLGVPLVATQSFEAYAHGKKEQAETELVRLDIAERVANFARRDSTVHDAAADLRRQLETMSKELESSCDIISPREPPTVDHK